MLMFFMKKNMNIEMVAEDSPQTPATRHPAVSRVPDPSAPWQGAPLHMHPVP
jgi:hypothetical protein